MGRAPVRFGAAAAVALGALAVPAIAQAGRTNFGWLFGTEVLPERGAELQTWIAEQNNGPGQKETDWWIGPLIGVTDQLELALPVQTQWTETPQAAGPAAGKFTLYNYGIEARYRFVSSDPAEAPAFVPLLRVAVYRLVTERDAVAPEADLVGSYDVGCVQTLVDLGWTSEISSSSSEFEFHPGAGVSIKATDELRFGAEVHAEIPLEQSSAWWIIAGPNVAWTHGRFWLSAAYGIGLHGIDTAPRAQWGISF